MTDVQKTNNKPMIEKFPTLNSTLAPNELGKLIQQKYGLSEKTECKIFRLGMNHLYIVKNGLINYVFRVYTHNLRTKLEIEEELRLLLHLKETSGQIAYPIVDKSNQFIQEIEASEGKRYGVLFSFAKGTKTAKFTEQTSFLIGQSLARVHQATDNFELRRISYNAENLVQNSFLKAKAFYSKNTCEIEFLENLSIFLTEKINNINRQKVRYGSIHLDVWFDNLHIDDEEGITFFDFDFCGNGYLCFDISYFLYQLLATNLNEEEYQIKASSFLKGYESVIQISNEEKELLNYACLAIMLYYIRIQCERFDYWTNLFLNEDHLKRMVGNLKRWINYNKIEIFST